MKKLNLNLLVCAALVAALPVLTACQTPSPDKADPAVMGDGDAPALPMRALGQEPGWILRLDEEQLTLDYQYGEHQFSAPTPERTTADGLTRYRAQQAGEELLVEITREYCEDIMSGRPFPYRVELIINGEPLSGCGGDTRKLLVGHEWQVTTINEQPLVDREKPPTITFDRDGQVAGSAGCNRYSGTYEITGEGVSFGSMALTRKACEPEVMQQEAEMMAVLEGASNFRLDDSGALIIRGYRGQKLWATAKY